MAKELLKTPLIEVRWCKLLGPARRSQFDPTKRPEWSCEALLDNNDKSHIAWLQTMEDKMAELHPGQQRIHRYGFPWKPGEKGEKWDDTGKTIVKFRMPEFTRKDGTSSEGPTLFDSAKRPWDQNKEIGNGSKLIIGFDIYAWSGPTGVGMTFQPLAAQVVELVEYQGKPNAEEAFDVVPGGFVDDSIPF